MRRINKGSEPVELTDYKSRGKRQLEDYALRQKLREALCREQHYICAFCQAEIAPDAKKMRIAHVVPQSDPKDGARLAVEWTNLVGSCSGGEGKPSKEHHCDKKQSKDRLPDRLDPVRLQPGTIRYDSQARVVGCDAEVQHAIENVLGLNIWKLRNLRDNMLKTLQHVLDTDGSDERLAQEIARLEDPDATHLAPCVDYLLWRLRERLSSERRAQ